MSGPGPSGIVYLIGAGPGDPGLLTVRGRDLLHGCDAIATDALANPAIVAAARLANPRVEIHDVGKRGGSSESTSQDDINALLVRLGREGKRVVRLKGGGLAAAAALAHVVNLRPRVGEPRRRHDCGIGKCVSCDEIGRAHV